MSDRDLRKETTVLRHAFRQERHKNRADIIQHIHDVENCDLCGLLAERDAALERAEQAEKERDRARFLTEHLFQMIPPLAWREQGGDDGQGHYEGDYWAAGLEEEIRGWGLSVSEEQPK